MDSSSPEEIRHLYRKRANRYNFTANLYYLIGFREWAFRKMAIEALHLGRGDTVVEVGCGTGLNFSLLQEAIGSEGKIIGVDMTDAMLVQAEELVKKKRWSNVELVQSDASEFNFPAQVDGILSTFALSLAPEFDKVIQNGARALRPGGRWVVLDLKVPSNWIARVAPFLVFLVKPFGASIDVMKRRLWESMSKYLQNVSITDLYWGIAYIAAGEAERHMEDLG